MTFGRALLLIWLGFHLVTMVASMTKDLPLGKALRPYTDWYQWRVGVHQNWTMYAPNPRMQTIWVEYVGIRADGSEVPLDLFVGRPDPKGWITRYVRAGKLERNSTSRKHIRASFVRWYCRTSKEAGDPLKHIRAEKVTVPTPPPDKRADMPDRTEWPEKRVRLETWNCRS